MIKKIILVLPFLLMTLLSSGQNKVSNEFEGKVFKIDNYIGDKFDNSEDLTFNKGYVEGSICIKYGFKKAKYNISVTKKGEGNFSCTMISKEHGKMVWHGTLVNDAISGKYLWTKEGQNPINYTFTGKIKEDEK